MLTKRRMKELQRRVEHVLWGGVDKHQVQKDVDKLVDFAYHLGLEVKHVTTRTVKKYNPTADACITSRGERTTIRIGDVHPKYVVSVLAHEIGHYLDALQTLNQRGAKANSAMQQAYAAQFPYQQRNEKPPAKYRRVALGMEERASEIGLWLMRSLGIKVDGRAYRAFRNANEKDYK